MSDQKQICPILSVGKPVPAPCKGIECAWFIFSAIGTGEPSGCSLKVLAVKK